MRFAFVWLLAFFLLVFTVGVEARDIYVNNACSVNGNGQSTTCGSSGPYNDLHVALQNVQAGDTVYVMQGTGVYATNNTCGGWPQSCGGFSVGGTGTASQPIRITTYQGANPLFTNCDEFSNTYYCGNPTFHTSSSEYIIFDGLRIQVVSGCLVKHKALLIGVIR